MKFVYALFPVIIIAISFCIILFFLFAIRFYTRRRRVRSPFTENFLRDPGASLRKQMEDIYIDIETYLSMSLILPLMVYSVHISQSYFGSIEEDTVRIACSVFLGIVSLVVPLNLLLKALSKRRALQLGYDGEIAVGQYLNQMMQSGYHVFHDFPCENFNIDHIAVGPAGVFAVETKARRKPMTGDRKAEALVEYDGKLLKFPTWNEVKPLEQAVRQAEWLTSYLAKSVGEKVVVQPIIALPGWYVKRIKSGGIPVINPKNFKGILKGNKLPAKLIQQIAYQLEQKCRDVEPHAEHDKNK